jgi:phosphatidylglycerol lysyltransferase
VGAARLGGYELLSRRAEKGFSLGFFAPGYLTRTPVAVVRVQDRLVAFANVWFAGQQEELSPDPMRYANDAPKGTMRYLFAHLMLHGKDQGYRWFNLGMASLSGMENSEFAPLWHRIAHQVFRHGDHFYNFEGLRHFKESFGPVWRSRYLACRAGLQLPAVFSDLVGLIGRKRV